MYGATWMTQMDVEAKYVHLRLHLAPVRNIDIDYIHLLPGFCIQTVYLKQNHRAQLVAGTSLSQIREHKAQD